jgi:hypothetical protein
MNEDRTPPSLTQAFRDGSRRICRIDCSDRRRCASVCLTFTNGSVTLWLTWGLSNGNSLVEMYQTLRHARTEIADRTLHIRHLWLRTSEQLEFLKKVWPSMQQDHQINQLDVLAALKRLLKKAKHKTERLTKRVNDTRRAEKQRLKIKRWKYVLVKPFLDATIRDLMQWQKIYDPSWFLILRIADPLIDKELQKSKTTRSAEGAAVVHRATKIRTVLSSLVLQQTPSPSSTTTHIFLPSERLTNAESSSIPFSSASGVRLPGQSNVLIIDPVPFPTGADLGAISQDFRHLASKLKVVDPINFGILKCRGVVKHNTSNAARSASLNVVFDAASTGQPCTLRSKLMDPASSSLTDRMHLAKQLATAVSYVHTLDFVHKNIRPENLIGFEDPNNTSLMPFYLIGFEQLRTVDGKTHMRGDDDWWKNMYRHPDRQGLVPEEKYNIGHDTYSLGVCLLEIGLWHSFVKYSTNETPDGTGEALRLGVRELQKLRPRALKDHLVNLARSRLPQAMGDVYAAVVHECLTYLDDDDDDVDDAADGDEEANALLVGVRFHEQVSRAVPSSRRRPV